MKAGAPGTFGAQLKALREVAGFTQEELATIAGLSVHAVSALERGERRRPHVDTVRALSAALDLTAPMRDALLGSARAVAPTTAGEELSQAFLPLPLTILIGRDADMEALGQWLADPALRLITLIGPGGVGKTRLVLELARAVAAESSVRVRFVSLAPLRDPAFVAPTIAEALGLSDVTALDLPKRARAACADQPTLLVLDNFEHLLDAAPLVAGLLTSALSLRLLVTSRAPLHVRGEREYVVGPLALQAADATSPADLARVPAVRLFVERVRDVRPDFRLTPANGPTVAAICRRLDALPLALELAAPWVKVLTLEDLLNGLEHDTLPGTVSVRDLPERQQTTNATVAWSYQLLGPEEQGAFRRLGILPGRFSIDAAKAVLAGDEDASHGDVQVLRLVGGLIDKSLLQRSETSVVASCPLYLMLDTMRTYATQELDAAGERDEALEGLARYCASEASLAAVGLVGPGQVQWLDRVREDLESYRVVLTWLIEHGRLTEAAHIAWGLLWFWVIRGHAVEGLHWYEEILRRPLLPPGVESRALMGAAGMRYWQGDLDRARTGLSRALALSQGSGDTDAAVHAEYILGYVEYAAGNLDAARDRLARAVEGFHAQKSPWGAGQALTGLAWVALAAGDRGKAERLLDEAVPALRDAGPWFLLLVGYLRAILAVRHGNEDDAIALVRENLTRIRELKDQSSFVYTTVPLAAAAALKGDDAWVARIIGARDAVTDRTGATVVDDCVRDLREYAERDARARLGAERWDRAYAAGRGSSIEALVQDIDRART
jgi:predicted ATPase/DNA-binding XRE family transcriptional regulator